MRFIPAALAVFLTVGTLTAQRGPRGQRAQRDPEAVKAFLNLSDEQVTALRENQRAKRQAGRSLMQGIGELGRQLREEMSQDNPSPTVAGQALVDMKAKREEIKALNEEYHAKALDILDDTQKNALTSLEQARAQGGAIREATGLGLLEAPNRGEGGFRGAGGFGPGMFMHGRGGPGRGFGGRRGPGPAPEGSVQ